MAQILKFSLSYHQDLPEYLASHFPHVKNYRLLSKSLDARNAAQGRVPRYHYILQYGKPDEGLTPPQQKWHTKKKFSSPPIIVGLGPAGLFCALRFKDYGISTTILEQGEPTYQRMKKIAHYWRYGQIDPKSNVCFGEGGAGLFSDGKLMTRIKSPFIPYITEKFIEYGAPPEIAWLSNPHVGSHKIRKVIANMAQDLQRHGHSIHYKSKVTSFITEGKKVVGVLLENGEKKISDHIILATGHSARDLYHHLYQNNFALKAKPFAIGVRIEHPRKLLDKMQYGSFQSDKQLGAADYRLSWTDPLEKRGTFSFCMCPGGYVLSSATEANTLVTNGMSNHGRNSPWSNAAIVVQVEEGKDFPQDHPLSGLKYQEAIEQKAYELSQRKATGKELPAMYVTEFITGEITSRPLPQSSAPSRLFKQDLREILPDSLCHYLRESLLKFDQKIQGFATCQDAIIVAPETRTSAPVTLLRDKKNLTSLSHPGLYPCGEGAGYAGGITSAAADGIKVCEAILQN